MNDPEITNRFSVRFWIVLAVIVIGTLSFLDLGMPFIREGEAKSRITVEIDGLRVALRSYKVEFGNYPQGDNRAISRALTGQNPRNIVFFISHESPDGDLLDPWGTPYKFYFSSDEVLIRSAGPNKRFDDGVDKHFDDYIR